MAKVISDYELEFAPHFLFPELEQARANGFSIIKDMRQFGFDKEYEIMTPWGDVVRRENLAEVQNLLKGRG